MLSSVVVSQLASTPVYRLREAGKRPGYQKRGCSPQAPLRIAQAAEVPKALATVLDCRAMMTDQGDNFQILNFMVGMTSFTRFLQDCVIFPEGIRFRGGFVVQPLPCYQVLPLCLESNIAWCTA